MACAAEAAGAGHAHGGGGACEHKHDVEDPDGDSLLPAIDLDRVRCLNEGAPNSGRHPFKAYAARLEPEPALASDEDDGELILHVPFTHAVKIKSVAVIGGGGGAAPTALRLYTNREDVDFAVAADLPPAQVVELVEDQAAAPDVSYPLKLHKFQNVSSLTIHVPGNFADDGATVINFLGLKGEQTVWRHGVVECVYEARPQAEDHRARAGNGGASSDVC